MQLRVVVGYLRSQTLIVKDQNKLEASIIKKLPTP